MARSRSFEPRHARLRLTPGCVVLVLFPLASCSSSGDSAAGDASVASNGGGSSGGSSSGGVAANGGAGGSPSGGASNGGAPRGGSSNGGTSMGGSAGGGTSGSTGTGGRSGTDAGSADSGNPPGPCATALFCETFEGYTAGSPPGGNWNDSTNNGDVSVVTTEHFGGQKSAMFSTQSNSTYRSSFIRLAGAPVFPVPGNTYFGRMMARLESAPEQSVHWTFIQGGGVVPGQTYHALYRYGGQHPVGSGAGFVGTQLMANYETPDSYSGNGPSSDCWDHAESTVMPTARWACVEWQFDGPNDTMRFWLDGSAVDSLTVQGTGEGCVHPPGNQTWEAPLFDFLDLGWESYQTDSARTLYIDDIVLSSSRVGCPAPP